MIHHILMITFSRFDRYVFRQLLTATVVVSMCLLVIVWLARSLKFMEYIVDNGASFLTFAWITTLALPTALSFVSPIALFVAVLFTFYRLQQDSELVIAKAVGLTPSRISRPAMYMAFIITMIGYALSLGLVPLSQREFRDVRFDIQNNISSVFLEEGAFNEVNNTLTVYIRERTSEGELRGIVVEDSTNPEKPSIIVAQTGALVNTEKGPQVIVLGGHRQEYDKETGKLTLLNFDQYSLAIQMAENQGDDGWLKPRERFLPDLLSPDPQDERDQRFASEMMALAHQMILQPLYSLSFTLVVLMCLIFAPFNRREQSRPLWVAFGLVLVWEVAMLTANNLARKENAYIILMYVIWAVPTLWMSIKLFWSNVFSKEPKLKHKVLS